MNRDRINRENTEVLAQNNAFYIIILCVVFFVGAYSVYGEMGRGRIRTAKRINSHWWGVAVPDIF